MRHPRRLYGEIGLRGFIAFQLVVGGNVVSALIHPIFLAGILYEMAERRSILFFDPSVPSLAWLYGATLLAGYLTSIVLGLRGLARRRLLPAAWALLLVPVHWVLLSLAAWRALVQVITNPYGWEKTEHGRAHTSRLANMASVARLDSIFRNEHAPPAPRSRRARGRRAL